jgi:hypothetical protein
MHHGSPSGCWRLCVRKIASQKRWKVEKSFATRKERQQVSLYTGMVCICGEHFPAGVFVDNAMALVPIPPWTEAQVKDYFDRAMKDALQHGLTSIHDAATRPDVIKFFMK